MDSTNSKPKRTPRRAAKDRWEEEKLLTSDKSLLVDLDLVKLLALPEAWDHLEEAEKKEILDLLPSDIHPNPNPPADDADAKIPPLPGSFLRYSNHWRDGIRNFQLDLQNGRHDPQWQREAEEAMQQRAAGKFDKFKEGEFEQFWGQKQTMDRSLAAGQSSRVKMSTLIAHGVIRKGDVWKWSRGFSKPKTLIEKEARITDITDSRLTFAVPPGQRVFLGAATSLDAGELPTVEKLETSPSTPPLSPLNEPPVNAETSPDSKDAVETGLSRKRSVEPDDQFTVVKRPRGRPRKEQPAPREEKESNLAVEIINTQPDNELTSPSPNTKGSIESYTEIQKGSSQPLDESPIDVDLTNESPSPSPPTANEESDEIVIPDIQGPTALTLKILEIDGRITDATNGNAWKELRCFRDNQDMGTLWELRHAWYLKAK
ncbi:Asx homology domain-containing protein [Aspergillus cavernicola]|uniref:Asx homology domain-containing protein n=1 Tax=Aspergillus cavernicola TaxID=176166 RepID=A0ABR4IKE6_9EURO